MSTISAFKTFSSGEVLTAADLNSSLSTIINDYNGSITNANIGASAAISLSKLSSTPATLTGSETLTNKTLTSPVINVGSDAQGDLYYRNASGIFTRLAPGTSGQVLKTQGGSANPVWASMASVVDSDTDGTSITTSSTFAGITGADVSITTTSTSHHVLMATVQAYGNVDLAAYTIQWHDGSAVIGASSRVYLRNANPRTSVVIMHIVPSKVGGTYTYTLQHKSEDNSSSLTAETFSLNVFSLPA